MLFNSLLARRQDKRSEVERMERAQEAEKARALQYFSIGQQGQLTREQLKAQADQFDKKITAEQTNLKTDIDARAEAMKKQLAANLEIAGLNAQVQREGFAMPSARMAELQIAENLDRDQVNDFAEVAAAQANQLLDLETKKRGDAILAASEEINKAQRAFTPLPQRTKLYETLVESADRKYREAISTIPKAVGEGGALISYDPKTLSFVPRKRQPLRFGTARSMIPPTASTNVFNVIRGPGGGFVPAR